MTKKELVQRICRDCRLTRSQASRALGAIARSLAAGVVRGEPVKFTGFGTFSVRRRSPRTGGNLQAGRRIRLRRRRTVQFTPSRALRRKIA